MLRFFRDYRYFFLAFLISLLLFGAMFGATCLLILNNSQTVDTPAPDVPISEQPYTPKAKDNLDVVWMGCAKDDAQPAFYLLLHFDAVQNHCTVVSIPPQTSATVNILTKTIDGFYTYGGMRSAAQAVANLFLLDSAYYVRTNFEETKMLVDYFAGITYTLEQSIQTAEYQFPAGNQQLDGSRTASLLFCQTFSQKSNLMQSILNQRFTNTLANSLDSFYDLLFDRTATDLNRVLFNQLDLPVHRFLRSKEQKTDAATLSGTMVEEVFVPDDTALTKLRSKFAKPETASDEQIAKRQN